jgi:hypothetical protein
MRRDHQIREEKWSRTDSDGNTVEARIFVERGNVVPMSYELTKMLLSENGFEMVEMRSHL